MLHALRDGSIAGDETGPLRLPDALRASVRARLAHVPPEARRVLDVAAVQGRGVDFETLTALTGAAPASVSNGLEMLVGRRLLSETADGVYDFSHDKLREVAYLEIGGARRLLLHRALAETLEGQGADNMSPEHSARLAEHYERGHAWPEALEQMVAAAERSERLFALRDALRWLDRAVALVQVHPDAARRVGLVELYDRRGSVRAQIGETAGAVADIRRVIEAANASRDHAKARDALIRLGMTYRRGDDYAEAIACLAAALEECRANGDERGAADTFYHLGTVAWSDGRNREAIAYHAQAVAICERLGLADLVAVQAYHGRGEAHFSNLEPRAAIACYERSIELARGIGEKSYESENLMMVGYAWTGSMGLGDYVTAAAKFEAALEIAQRADLQWHIGPTLLGGDHVRACTGRYGEAYEGMIRTLDWLESSGQIRYQLMAFDFLAQLLLDAGLNAEAAACAERALALSQRSNVTFWRPRLAADRAIARLRLGDLDAGPELERDLARCRGQNELYQMTRCLEACAELALARGDVRGCLAFAAELRDCADAAGLVELSGSAHRWLGEALIRLGDSGAVAELALAARAAREVGRVRLAYDVDRARATLGDENEAERWSTLIRESLAGSPLADARARGARP
jgi:tetratricopeptide (TPR) repeat protein